MAQGTLDGLSLAAFLQDPAAFNSADREQMKLAVSKVFDAIAKSDGFRAQKVLDSKKFADDAATLARDAATALSGGPQIQALAAAQERIKLLEAEVAGLENGNQRLVVELEETNQEAEDLTKELNTLKNKHKDMVVTIASLTDQNKEQEDALEEAESEIERLTAELKTRVG